MSFLINTPPTLDGDNATKILQLYKHLYKMSEEVNYALNALASGNVVDLTGTTQARQTFATALMGGTVENTKDIPNETYNELKSLIIKTGNAVNNSIDEANKVLYEISDSFGITSDQYGSYAEAISNTISVSAKNIINEYGLVSKLESLDDQATGFAKWMVETKGFIKTGILYTDEDGEPRIGVAVGTNVSKTLENGMVQSETTDLLATFVSDVLTFWQGGQKVAYLSNKKLYILSAEFIGSFRVGDFQWISSDIGLILEYLGEDGVTVEQ